ncbi:glycosyltransferase family 2 protein [Aeromonas caviae]
MASWTVNEPIRVSVCCITYKQEQYIAQAIESFLVQKTTFPFEIVIGEDCGGDGTLPIIYEYQKRYPTLIRVITSEQNVGANANLLRVFNAAQGDYIAVCEGDDYWIDENKLEGHVDFLDKNKSVALHMYDCLEEVNGLVQETSSKLKRMGTKQGLYYPDQIRNGFCMMLISSCFKNIKSYQYPSYFHKSINFDTLLSLDLANYGSAYVDDSRKVAVYRLQEGGIWSNKTETYKFYESMHTLLVHARYLETEINSDVYIKKILILVIFAIKKIGMSNFIFNFFRLTINKFLRMLKKLYVPRTS